MASSQLNQNLDSQTLQNAAKSAPYSFEVRSFPLWLQLSSFSNINMLQKTFFSFKNWLCTLSSYIVNKGSRNLSFYVLFFPGFHQLFKTCLLWKFRQLTEYQKQNIFKAIFHSPTACIPKSQGTLSGISVVYKKTWASSPQKTLDSPQLISKIYENHDVIRKTTRNSKQYWPS